MFSSFVITISILFYYLNNINAAFTCNILQNEYNALNALFISTNGANWRNNINKWIFPSELDKPCSTISKWYGLICIEISQNLCAVTQLNLGNNNLIGSISSEIGEFNYLKKIIASNNRLQNSIPNELINLKNLTQLILQNNFLQGSIPNNIGNLTQLNYLSLYNNSMTGEIPTSLGSLVLLTALGLNLNKFTSTIPTNIGFLTKLLQLNFNYNKLTNTIPSQLGNLINLNYLEICCNKLIGSISSEFGNLNHLNYLDLDHNLLSSSIPFQLGNLLNLISIDLSYNNLIGTIPSSIQHLNNLTTLFLNQNELNGNLDNIFNSSIQNKLSFIDLSNNHITGSISSEIFGLSSLQTFSLTDNCIHGSIPIEICSLTTLNTLILDGIYSKCGKIFPFVKTKYHSGHVIKGGIPSCVFNMSSLVTLHLSGNSITGTLDSNIILNNKLSYLDLSTNLFTGKIPKVIQIYKWNYLNLGFNRFKDTINNEFPKSNSSTLILSNNRLSGYIPSSLNSYSLNKIDILEGNIFSCSTTCSNDINSNDYECGTILLYRLIIVFISITIIIILIKLRYITQKKWNENINKIILTGKEIQNTFVVSKSSLSSSLDKFEIENDNDNNIRITDGFTYIRDSNITILIKVSENFSRFLIFIFVFICLWLVSSIVLHQFYSTYDFMYGYNLSMTFLSGHTSAIIYYILIVLSIILVHHLIQKIFLNSLLEEKNIFTDNKAHDNSNHVSMFILVFIINLMVMIIVNGLFVQISLGLVYKRTQFNEITILLSIFKMVWKSKILPLLLSIFIKNDDKKYKDNTIRDKIFVKLNIIFLCSVGILNTIIIPFLVTSFLSTNCFFYIIRLQPRISASYSYNECTRVGNNGVCLQHDTITKESSYQPPFSYSYQCSSTLTSIYDSVYIYSSIILILQPLLATFIELFFKKFNKYPIIIKLMKVLPSIFKPLDKDKNKNNDDENEDDNDNINDNNYCTCRKSSILSNVFFNQTEFIVNTVIFLVLLCTVGFIVPLVGIIICISLYLYTHGILSNIGGKLNDATVKDKKIFEKECENLIENLIINLNLFIYLIMGLFFSLFVFDTIGNQEGFSVGFIYFIITLCSPLMLWFLKRLYMKFNEEKKRKNNNKRLLLIELKNANNNIINVNPIITKL